jgi:type II secretory pathway component PulF
MIAAIALISAFSVYAIKKSNEHLNELVQRTEQEYLRGGDVKKALAELEDYWEDYFLAMTYITAEPTMSDMSRAVKKLPALYEAGSDDFLAELKSISDWAQLLYDTQFPDLSSIF